MTSSVRPTRAAGRTAWLVVGGVLTAAILAFGGLTVWSWLAHQSATEEQTYLRPVSRIELEVGSSGDVSLAPGPSGQVSVRRRLGWSLAKPRPTETWDGNTLRLRGGCTAIVGDCYLDYRLRVPADVTIVAHSSSGTLTVRDLTGDLDLSASSGDVEVTGTRGRLVVQTSSGDVRASGLRSGSVEVRVSSGDAHLDFSQAPRVVRATASAGDIDVTVPRGVAYDVQADADSGSTAVTVDRSLSSPYGIIAHASSGDVRVRYGP